MSLPAANTAPQATQHPTVWRNNIPEKHRKCEDGRRHRGNLEIVTWDSPYDGTFWGACAEKEEAEELKKQFEVSQLGLFPMLIIDFNAERYSLT